MLDMTPTAAGPGTKLASRLWSDHRVWLVTATILTVTSLLDPTQGVQSLAFTTQALLETSLYLLPSIGLAAHAGATGADMTPSAGLAFLVAGGVTSLPATIAVWALAKRPVFVLNVVLALIGSLTSGLLFQAWTI